MILEPPNSFSAKAEWQRYLNELLSIEQSSLSEDDLEELMEAIEKAEAFLQATR
jgi:hypothetical protein